MGTPLMRESLQGLYKAAWDVAAHVGLLLQRGWEEHVKEGEDAEHSGKTKHLRKVCNVRVDDFYSHAYRRWKMATADPQRFYQLGLALRSRLFIGTAGAGALETGCAIGHSHGMPYIPGSSVKGVVNAHARQRFQSKGEKGRAVCEELFGSGTDQRHPGGLAGRIRFHDAWWMPGSAESPLVPEVVTSHHPDYYGKDGTTEATDFDSPVSNAQVAVRGSFLFVMEGPSAWLGLASEILADALHTRGIGAKTRAGYGYFKVPEAEPSQTCEWVDSTIADLRRQNYNAPAGDMLRSPQLAQRCAEIEDPSLKRAAIEDICRRWHVEGWWYKPPSKAARKAKNIYSSQFTED